MKKLFKSIICLLLILSIGVSTVGCGSKNSGQTGGLLEQDKIGEIGTHVFNMTDTQDYIVKNGVSDYKLVMPEKPTKEELTAKEEFVELFKEATGVSIVTVSDGGVLTHDANAKYISLGYTSVLKSAFEQEYNERFQKLGYDGVRIITKDKSVYMFGGSDVGTTFSVYTFMEVYFNFDQYYRNCYDLDTGVTDVVLKNFDITDIPDVEFRFSATGVAKPRWDAIRNYESSAGLSAGDIANRDRRMRLDDGNSGENMIPVYSGKTGSSGPAGTIHNTEYYVSKADLADPENSAMRTKWMSGSGNQLCYTAHGDPEAYEALVEHCADKIIYSMSIVTPEKNPRRHYVPFTQMDSGGFCTCDACAEEQARCGGLVIGSLIKLAKRIIDRVYELQALPENQAFARDNLRLVIFAYAQTQYVPANYDEKQDKWIPFSEEFAPNDRMCIWLCPTKASFINDIYEPINDATRKNIQGWAALAEEMWFWTYPTYYNTGSYFCDSFAWSSTDTVKFLASTNATMIFPQESNSSCSDEADWTNLKIYLNSKLYWNCNLDSEKLIQKYFKAMFKDASDEMFDAFTFLRDYMSQFRDDPAAQQMGAMLNTPEYYPYTSVLKVYIEKLDKAVEAIEKYKVSDPGTYDLVMGRISLEYIFPIYAVFEIYGKMGSTTPFGHETKIAYKQKLYDMASKYFPELFMSPTEREEILVLDWLATIN